ncbi:AbrB/MazE/SpoVT family DNA-binding domain-containing protein [Paenibacillus periandrae]|uniref:AbrB/MazE/SpoVT family DNA-binding domain-containing protein n=1 Tax=Paenibacillus periandrae TaxID=1761741 RepID=UPI001F0951CA|nr:AbrB/MazE/SpoVT family DNA-binding domain-containing protein [Paenibacillus periandrae]
MKGTGIVRRIDDLGRVVIPKEIRRTFGISEGDPLEIFVDGDLVLLRKYVPGCILCGSLESLTPLCPGKEICAGCIKTINAIVPIANENQTAGTQMLEGES